MRARSHFRTYVYLLHGLFYRGKKFFALIVMASCSIAAATTDQARPNQPREFVPVFVPENLHVPAGMHASSLRAEMTGNDVHEY